MQNIHHGDADGTRKPDFMNQKPQRGPSLPRSIAASLPELAFLGAFAPHPSPYSSSSKARVSSATISLSCLSTLLLAT